MKVAVVVCLALCIGSVCDASSASIMSALYSGDVETLERALAKEPLDEETSSSALVAMATEMARPDLLGVLLDHGATFSAEARPYHQVLAQHHSMLRLHHCEAGYSYAALDQLIDVLLEHSVPVEGYDALGNTAFQLAVQTRHVEAIAKLARPDDCAVGVHGKRDDVSTALHFAVDTQRAFKMLMTMILQFRGNDCSASAATAPLNTYHAWGLDALALEDGSLFVDSERRTVARWPVWHATIAWSRRIATATLDACPQLAEFITAPNEQALSALHIAARSGDAAVAALLVERSHEPLTSVLAHSAQSDALTPLHIAAARNFPAVLIAMGCATKLHHNGDWTAFQSALESATDSFGRTPSHIAGRAAQAAIHQLLHESTVCRLRHLESAQDTQSYVDWLEFDEGAHSAAQVSQKTNSDDCDVWTVHSPSEYSAAKLHELFISTRTPFRLRRTDSFANWTLSVLEETLNTTRIQLQPIPHARQFGEPRGSLMTFAEFAQGLRERTIIDEYYTLTRVPQSLLSTYESPKVFQRFSARNHLLFVGPRNSGAPEHFHLDAFNTLFVGHKEWLLVEPRCATMSVVRAPDYASTPDPTMSSHPRPCPLLRCTQHPGDVIYVPLGWGHSVLNRADVNVALAIEF